MDYLLITLWPWVSASLALGFLVGWLACSPRDDKSR
jgi:hypothetical protein